MQLFGIQFAVERVLDGPARVLELIQVHKNPREIDVCDYIIGILPYGFTVEFGCLLILSQGGVDVAQVT